MLRKFIQNSRSFATKEPAFLEQVELFFEEAAKISGIRSDLLKYIKKPNAVIKFNIPLIRENGEIQVMKHLDANTAGINCHAKEVSGFP